MGLTIAGIECEPQVKSPGVGRVDVGTDDGALLDVDGRQRDDDATSFERGRHRDRAAGVPASRACIRRRHAVLRWEA